MQAGEASPGVGTGRIPFCVVLVGQQWTEAQALTLTPLKQRPPQSSLRTWRRVPACLSQCLPSPSGCNL